MRINRFQVFYLLQVQVFAALICYKTFCVLWLSQWLVFCSSCWVRLFVYPLDSWLASIVILFLASWWDRTHLGVDEGVSQQKFLARVRGILVGKLVPFARDVQVVEVLKASFVQGQLVDEGGSDLQIRPATVEELKALQQRPFVLAHDVAGEGARCTTLPTD